MLQAWVAAGCLGRVDLGCRAGELCLAGSRFGRGVCFSQLMVSASAPRGGVAVPCGPSARGPREAAWVAEVGGLGVGFSAGAAVWLSPGWLFYRSYVCPSRLGEETLRSHVPGPPVPRGTARVVCWGRHEVGAGPAGGVGEMSVSEAGAWSNSRGSGDGCPSGIAGTQGLEGDHRCGESGEPPWLSRPGGREVGWASARQTRHPLGRGVGLTGKGGTCGCDAIGWRKFSRR